MPTAARGAGTVEATDTGAAGVASTGGLLNYNYDNEAIGTGAGYHRIVVRAVEWLDYTPGGIDWSEAAQNDRGAADELHGESGDDFLYGLKGDDVLFGEGQDDDLIGGYGNDWMSGGTGDDGAIGDDGRFMTSRNATTYGEPLHGVAALLPDNGDTRTFNGNMLNEVIATPGSIQQATINVSGALKKSVNLTPFSFDPTFNGMWDEFTTVDRKTVDDQGLPAAHNADDVIFGGLGSDWLHGGSGDDAISGGEALGEAYTQVYTGIDLTGVERSDYYRPYNPVDALRYNPVDLDGWHKDSTRRAGEFALYDEYDPLRKITLNADGAANKTDVGGLEWFLNFSNSEGVYVPAGTIPGNGQQATSYPEARNDGNDRIFGDTGNDWLVGGTGRDDIYGGFGNDLLNADDNHATNLLRNDQPDTQPTFEDRAFGGAGRDVLIGNTGGDRLIDWVGEFNSYLVPFAPFGMGTVSRTLQPQLAEFLYALSASDGADPTRWADTNADPAQAYRNGEPEGELGVVRQKDFAWQSQTGAPADPQAGNIPGGQRDVLRTANFNDGTTQALAPDSGTWQVSGGVVQVAANSNKNDAVVVYQVGDALPSYFEALATIKIVKPTGGWDANSYVIFDYQNTTSFKFAGLNAKTNKLEMGQRTAAGWQVLKQASFPGGVKNDTWYNVMLSVNGLTATLIVNNTDVFSHTYAPTIVDGWSYGLNWGLVGFGSNKSRGAMDNITVQIVPPTATVTFSDDFSSGAGPMFTGDATGTWVAAAGRYAGTPAPASNFAVNLMNLAGVTQLATTSILDLSATFRTSTRAGFVFDRYGPDDFKWVALDVQTQQILVGHRTPKNGWKIDAAVARTLLANTDYTLGVVLRGSTMSVTLNGQAVAGYVYNAVTVDGTFGLLAVGGAADFDKVTVKTNDPSVAGGPQLLAGSPQSASGSDGVMQLTSAMISPIVVEAKQRWVASGLLDAAALAQLDTVSVQVANFGGLVLGEQDGNTILIDSDAAGYGWFVDTTPALDDEFRIRRGEELLAVPGSPARDKMDVLTVLMHEFGHALGLEHSEPASHSLDLMAETLAPSVRRLISTDNVTNSLSSSRSMQVSAVAASLGILDAVSTVAVGSEAGALTSSPRASFSPLDLALLAAAPGKLPASVPARKPDDFAVVPAPVTVEAVDAVFTRLATQDLSLPLSKADDTAWRVSDLMLGFEDDLAVEMARLAQRDGSQRSRKN